MLRVMTDVEAAWVGAMIEGEGCIRMIGSIGNRLGRIRVTSTDVETISTLLRVTGAGTVRGRSISGSPLSKKPQWEWEVHRVGEIPGLLMQVAPYLISKTAKAERVLNIHSNALAERAV